MKEIQLGKGAVALVDDDDYDRINAYKWKLNSGGYAIRTGPRINGRRLTIRMHREVARIEPGFDCDHIDMNKLNNQKENLRQATRSQNKANGPGRVGSSRFKGVCLCRNGKWQAAIKVNYKYIFLGRYELETDAALAYNEAATRYFGEFARTNAV